MERQYSGVDILEALESAHNYNDYLTRLIRESTESKDLIDFGAGIGTFSKRLRTAGYHVKCIEPDPVQRQKLLEEGFDTLDNITSIPDDSASFIFSLNVFEHIEHDTIAIRQVGQKLKPGGALLMSPPLSVSGQAWIRSYITIVATQKRPFGVLLSKKVSLLNRFAMQIASGLLLRLFFGC